MHWCYYSVLLPSVTGWFTLSISMHEKNSSFSSFTWQRQNFRLLSLIHITIQSFPFCSIRINVSTNTILFVRSSSLQGFSFCYWTVLNSWICSDFKQLSKVCRSAPQPHLRELLLLSCFWADEKREGWELQVKLLTGHHIFQELLSLCFWGAKIHTLI